VIYAVGDILLGDTPLCYRHGVGSRIKKNGSAYPFEQIRQIFMDGDILIGNLEAPISPTSYLEGIGKDFFRADPSVTRALKEAGFTALSVANNHTLDHGEQAFKDTIDLLVQVGIQPVGHRKEGEVIIKGGNRISILARTLVPDSHHNLETDSAGFLADILEEVRVVKNTSDLVIVYLHWGDEYVPYPSPEQVKLGRSLVDGGVDIVLGSHPHVLQGYEIYKNKPIFYSLGNFIADGFQQVTRRSCIVRIAIQESTSPFNISILPITIDFSQFRPVLSDGQEKDEILTHFRKVRNCLENISIEEYSARIGPYPRLIKINAGIALTQMKIYFIRNVYRYPPRLILASIWHFIKKIQKKYFYSEKVAV
jgi:poly-gamma-glutamate synthesis protein (capsule biosynthesis protein)